MNRRMFPVALAASCVTVAVGCNSEPKPSSTATLTNNDEVNSAMNSLDNSIGSLESSVGTFEDENWRAVVPYVQTDTINVRDAYRRLRRALGYTDA